MTPMPQDARVHRGVACAARLARGGSSRSRCVSSTGAVIAVLLALFLLTPSSHAGSLVRRGGFRELSVEPTDAAAGVELPDVFLIAGSDSVRVDGEALSRGVDYEIDYDLGTVVVMSAIPDDGTVTITYRFIPLNLK